MSALTAAVELIRAGGGLRTASLAGVATPADAARVVQARQHYTDLQPCHHGTAGDCNTCYLDHDDHIRRATDQ